MPLFIIREEKTMINEENRINLLLKEVETYRRFAALVPQIMDVIRKFDGKCINKRFETALNEAINGAGFTRETRKYYARSYFSGRSFKITITVYDNIYVKQLDGNYPDGTPIYDNYKISNDSYTFNFDHMTCGEWTLGGKNWRMNAEKMQEVFEAEKIALEEMAVNLEMEVNHAAEAVEEMREIHRLTKAFRNKYSYRFMEVMGISYYLQNNNTYGFSRNFHNV